MSFPEYDFGEIALPSGVVIWTADNHIGISEDLFVGTFYDFQDIRTVDGAKLTPAQEVELADIAIDRWRRFREQASQKL